MNRKLYRRLEVVNDEIEMCRIYINDYYYDYHDLIEGVGRFNIILFEEWFTDRIEIKQLELKLLMFKKANVLRHIREFKEVERLEKKKLADKRKV